MSSAPPSKPASLLLLMMLAYGLTQAGPPIIAGGPAWASPPEESSEEGEKDAERRWREPDQYLLLEVGFTIEELNYDADAAIEFQRFTFGRDKLYELRVDLSYVGMFSDQAYLFGFGGSYHPVPPLRTSLDIHFAPAQTIVPRQDYEVQFGLSPSGLLEASLRYQFQDYRQANRHRTGPILSWRPWERLFLSSAYEVSRTVQGVTAGLVGAAAGGGRPTNHAFWFRSAVRVFKPLTLWGSYGRSTHDFEAGAPDNPYKSFAAHDIGAGLRFSYLMGNGLFFTFEDQHRDNGQTIQAYTLGTFLDF